MAPSWEKEIAVALPMPVEAPVTSATNPSSLPVAMVEDLFALMMTSVQVWCSLLAYYALGRELRFDEIACRGRK